MYVGVCVCVCGGGVFVGWCKVRFFFFKSMFCLMGTDHNILNHLVRPLPPGAATIGSFIFLLLVCIIPMHATGR